MVVNNLVTVLSSAPYEFEIDVDVFSSSLEAFIKTNLRNPRKAELQKLMEASRVQKD